MVFWPTLTSNTSFCVSISNSLTSISMMTTWLSLRMANNSNDSISSSEEVRCSLISTGCANSLNTCADTCIRRVARLSIAFKILDPWISASSSFISKDSNSSIRPGSVTLSDVLAKDESAPLIGSATDASLRISFRSAVVTLSCESPDCAILNNSFATISFLAVAWTCGRLARAASALSLAFFSRSSALSFSSFSSPPPPSSGDFSTSGEALGEAEEIDSTPSLLSLSFTGDDASPVFGTAGDAWVELSSSSLSLSLAPSSPPDVWSGLGDSLPGAAGPSVIFLFTSGACAYGEAEFFISLSCRKRFNIRVFWSLPNTNSAKSSMSNRSSSHSFWALSY
mmetsp:Transcript_18996/g.26491  ORF Transcript_18996/g.26491 Transcript_18996/m.26491 type:complete len:339 (+) Transcript_18996:800-1816(+)